MIIFYEALSEPIGWHCSKYEIENDFKGEITGNYVSRFIREFVEIIKASNKYDQFIELIRENNDYYSEEGEHENVIEIVNIINDMPQYEYEENAYDELATIIENLNINILFVNERPLNQYGENCYKVYPVNKSYVMVEDDSEILAYAVIFCNDHNKMIFKK